MSKITLTNCYQCGNTGDVAIWSNIMREISKAIPKCEFTLLSQAVCDWDMNQLKEFNPKCLVGNIQGFSSEFIQSQDIFISQGGGYMIGNDMANSLQFYAKCQKLGKTVLFAPQTFVGEISHGTKSLLQEVLNKSPLVCAREPETFEWLKNNGINNIRLFPDQVFRIEFKNKSTIDYPVKIAFRGYNKSDEELKMIALLTDMIIETIGPVMFLAVGVGGNDGFRSDFVALDRLKRFLRHKDQVFISETKLNAQGIALQLQTGILISDRYHAIVYAISNCCPFIPISPDIDHKMNGLTNRANYIMDTVDWNIDLFNKVKFIWKNQKILRDRLNKVLPSIKSDVAEFYKLLIETIKNV